MEQDFTGTATHPPSNINTHKETGDYGSRIYGNQQAMSQLMTHLEFTTALGNKKTLCGDE